jgi:proline iminopeptidase
MVSLMDNAWRLYQHWPNSELHIIREAGHAAMEPGILDALIRAGQSMAHHKLNNQ